MNDFVAFNAVYARFFGESKPARSTVEVARLPKDALVEIEVRQSISAVKRRTVDSSPAICSTPADYRHH